MEKITLKRQDVQNRGIRDFLIVIFKYKARILIIFFTVVVVAAIASLVMTPVYEAKSTLLVKYGGREYMTRPEVGNTQPVISLNQEVILNSEIQILTSPDLLKKVIESLQVEKIYPDLAKNPPKEITALDVAIDRFGKNLVVTGIKKSSVIEVSFQHDNPQIAAKAVNLLVEYFREKHLQVFSNPQSSFLEGQALAYREKLLESANNLESFKQKNRVYSLDEQRTLLLKQRTDLHTELMTTQNSVDELQKKSSSLKAQMRNLTKDGGLYTQTERDRIIVEAKSRLLALELNEQDLLRKYNENNRMVVDARKQIQMVKNFMKEQEEDIKSKVRTGNVVYQTAQTELVRSEADLSAQRAKLAALNGQLRQLDGEIRTLDLQEKDMQGLKREMVTNEKNFQIYGDKMEEARIADDMNRLKLANISVIQPAAVPIKPLKPKKGLNMALGIILGMFSSIGFALFSERNSQGLITPELAAKRLNLAVIASIPYKE
jgi:polysaccharide biosynthesis protein PslE